MNNFFACQECGMEKAVVFGLCRKCANTKHNKSNILIFNHRETINMNEVIKPPSTRTHGLAISIFLAGSIEHNTAEDWQDRIIEKIKKNDPHTPKFIYNPRRDHWDSSWTQTLNSPEFYEQANWELDRLTTAKYVLFYFDPNSKSPISLMELGLMANSANVLVCCPQGFWRKGNVDILCQRYNIPVFENEDVMLRELSRRIRL